MKIFFEPKCNLNTLSILAKGTSTCPGGMRDVDPIRGKSLEIQSLQEVIEAIVNACRDVLPPEKKNSPTFLFSDLPDSVEIEVKGSALDAIQQMIQRALDNFNGTAAAMAVLVGSARSLHIDVNLSSAADKSKEQEDE